VLTEIMRQCHVVLHVHSDREPELPGIPYQWIPWESETEVEVISSFDIGIMPMPDNKWARGKCAMKALLYMAMGIPTICSAIGTNCEVITHGQNGFLATTTEDWVGRINELVGSCELREKLGAAGRKTVEDSYSMDQCARSFAAVVRQAVD
jgi:glycosyltransferase involved in cell wall biosynthesis